MIINKWSYVTEWKYCLVFKNKN